MSDTMKALDEIHDAKSELIMRTAPIRLAIMQGGEVSDRDRALCQAVEDLDAAIKRFVRASAALTPPADDEIEAIRARHEDFARVIIWSPRGHAEDAHADRATLLRAVDRLSAELAKERERRVEVEGALEQADVIAEQAMETAPDAETLGVITAARLGWQDLLPGAVSATLTKETP